MKHGIKLKLKKLIQSELNEANNKQYGKNLTDFVAGLEKLTQKTGWGIESTGGVYYDDPMSIYSVSYTTDLGSGDIDYIIKSK